jgi:hypothetical protein
MAGENLSDAIGIEPVAPSYLQGLARSVAALSVRLLTCAFTAAISVNGIARDLLLRGFRCDLVLYISDDVLTETERNLTRKAPEAVEAFGIFRDLLVCRLVKPTPTLVVSSRHSEAVDVLQWG